MSKRAAVLRRLKYGVVAAAIAPVVRFTPFLDGRDQTPPERINFAGDGDFRAIGDHQVALISERAGIVDDAHVLDIGCGIGRVALALRRRCPDIAYDGFDIVAYGIAWCRKQFADTPRFRFAHVDLYNSFYNPFGRLRPDDFRFPYADAGFDLLIATSLFTHLGPGTLRHYLTESARVMAPGGRLYLTTFLLPEGPIPAEAAFQFAHDRGNHRLQSAEEPDLAVAYSADFWHDAADAAGLRIEAVFRGSWAGAVSADSQDAVVLRKDAT